MKLPECRWLNLDYETATGWLTIEMNAPETRNALSKALSTELMRVLGQAGNDTSVRGISLRGTGGVFCAGGDIKSFTGSTEAITSMSLCGAELFAMLARQPQPTLALVDGMAAGGGVGLASVCDFVLATPSARFVLSEVRLGVIAAQIAPYLVERIGMIKARQLMMSGKILSAEDAYELGLVDRFTENALDMETEEAAIKADILKGAPAAIRKTKALLQHIGEDTYIEWAANLFAETVNSQEAKEGVTAFIQKRKPDWSRT